MIVTHIKWVKKLYWFDIYLIYLIPILHTAIWFFTQQKIKWDNVWGKRIINTADIFFAGGGLSAAVLFLLIIVSEVTPSATVERPISGFYLYLNMLLVVVAMGISTVVIWLYEQEDRSKRSYIVDKVKIDVTNLIWTDVFLKLNIFVSNPDSTNTTRSQS